MATAAPAESSPISRPFAGIAFIVIGMFFFVIQDLFMKSLLGEFTVWMLIAVRAVIAVLILTPMIIIKGPPNRLFTPLWPIHMLRGALFAFGFTMIYVAFPFMALVEVTTIFYSAPIFTALLAALFLGERIAWHRGIALLVGFIGVAVAMRPSSGAFQWMAICPLICAITYSISQCLARKIGDRETTATLGLYTLVFAGMFIVPMAYGLNTFVDLGDAYPHLRWDWQIPTFENYLILALLGSIGMVGIMLLWRAYQIAPASLVASFDYSYLPWAALFGYLLWNEVPNQNTLIGMVLIVGSGLYVGFREMLQARRAVEPAPTGEMVVVPANPVGSPAQLTADYDAVLDEDDSGAR